MATRKPTTEVEQAGDVEQAGGAPLEEPDGGVQQAGGAPLEEPDGGVEQAGGAPLEEPDGGAPLEEPDGGVEQAGGAPLEEPDGGVQPPADAADAADAEVLSARVVAIGAISYRRGDGIEAVGLHGETVVVHPDDVARFDRLNAPMPVPEEAPLDAELLLELAARRGETGDEETAAPVAEDRPELRRG